MWWKTTKKYLKKFVIELSNTFLKTPNFSLERRRRYTGVIFWDEHKSHQKSRNIMTMIVAAQHKPRADQICSQNQNICESSLTRGGVSETWKTCDWTAVNSGKPKFQFHISRQRKEMGRPGETCYVLILYFSYLEPYLLLHFFVFICLMHGSPMISALQ